MTSGETLIQLNDRLCANQKQPQPYLKVFGGARQDGAALLPHEALVVFQRPQDGVLLVRVPQQDPQVALGLPPQLVREDEAERSGVGGDHGAHQAGSLLLRLQAGVQVQVAVEL